MKKNRLVRRKMELKEREQKQNWVEIKMSKKATDGDGV